MRYSAELTFEISHECLGSRIKSINDHLPIGRTGDFYPVYIRLALHRQSRQLTSCPLDLGLGEHMTKLGCS